MRQHTSLLITLGAAIWCIGFFLGALHIYPWTLFFVSLGPLVLVYGLILWWANYKEGGNDLSSFIAQCRLIFRHMQDMKFHLSEMKWFWTLSILLLLVFTCIGTLWTKTLDSYEVAKEYTQYDTKLIEKIGGINYYGVFASMDMSNGSTTLHFSVIGNIETAIVKANVSEVDGELEVTSITYR